MDEHLTAGQSADISPDPDATQTDPPGPSGRRETDAERMDRKFSDLLQELRVMQTGAQLTAGFLLTLPFQSRFDSLDGFQHGLYLVLVLLATLITGLVLTPVAVHRRLSGARAKHRVVQTAHGVATLALTTISFLVVGMVVFIVDMVVDRTWAMAVGGVVAMTFCALLAILPWRLTRLD